MQVIDESPALKRNGIVLVEENEKELELWTHAKFRDECFLDLANVIDTNRSNSVSNERNYLSQRKYYAQARRLIYWIPITKAADKIPPFIINLSDLSPRCRKEFEEFVDGSTKQEIALFLKEITLPFFEAIDFAYCHRSIISHLQVEYVD
jgi:hypothetical protein